MPTHLPSVIKFPLEEAEGGLLNPFEKQQRRYQGELRDQRIIYSIVLIVPKGNSHYQSRVESFVLYVRRKSSSDSAAASVSENAPRLARAITSGKFLSKVFPRLTSVINFCYALPGAGRPEAQSLQ